MKRGCILFYHCILNTKQLVVKNKSNISENTDAFSFNDSSQIYVVCIPFLLSEAALLLDFVFLDRREHIKFLSWHNWLIIILCFMCMLLNQVFPKPLAFCKNASSCVCASAIFLVILHINDEHILDIRLMAVTFI